MSNISKTIQQYKTLEELQQFAESQNAVILQLSNKLKKLEEEKASNGTIIKNQDIIEISTTDSEYICQVEIAKLKKMTSDRELTLEESRRFDTYYKILNNINSKEKPNEKDVKELPTENLLQIVKSDADAKRSKS